MLIVTAASHLDHNLPLSILAFVLKTFGDRDGFFAETIKLPTELPEVPCSLYGPVMGDPAVRDGEVRMLRRGDRKGQSRMIERRDRMTTDLTVIAGPANGHSCLLYTMFGGPLAPREPWEVRSRVEDGLESPEELAASEAFWATHALAMLGRAR